MRRFNRSFGRPVGELKTIVRDCRGNTAAIFGLCVFPLFLVFGSAIDVRAVSNQKSDMQNVADSAALFAVRQMAIISDDPDRIEEAAQSYVSGSNRIPGAMVTTFANLEERTLTVNLTAPPQTYFGGPMSNKDAVAVSATAKLSGSRGNVCLIGLSEGVKRTIKMNKEARLTATGCAVYSNSTDPESVYINDKARIVADQVFSAGGFDGTASQWLKEPLTDAPRIADPLAGHPTPSYTKCDHNNLEIETSKQLYGGVYCGGLTIKGGNVKLFPGTYIIKNGPLTVKDGGTLTGRNVGFYLRGRDAKIDFDKKSHISLTAPKEGVMTGLLFYADPKNGSMKEEKFGKELKKGHLIRSDDARRLVGTIYLPDDKLTIDGEEPVGDKSEYTVIVAKAFELHNGPNLVLRTDYHLSDIPVPEGVGPAANRDAEVSLIE